MGATNPQLYLFVRELGAKPIDTKTAALFSVVAAANLIALPHWGRSGDRRGHHRGLLTCTLWTGGALLVHALAPGYEVLLLARVLLGVASAGSGPLAFGVAAASTTAERRGGAFGVVFSARALAVAVSAMIGGWLSAWVGVRGLFALGGAMIWFQLWRVHRRARSGA